MLIPPPATACAICRLHWWRRQGPAAPASCACFNVLGLQWNPSTDLLAVSVPGTSVLKTRREMLSMLSKPFDLLGVLTP